MRFSILIFFNLVKFKSFIFSYLSFEDLFLTVFNLKIFIYKVKARDFYFLLNLYKKNAYKQN